VAARVVPLQVVYPALDSKVKNVTLAYSVEHEDEVRPWMDTELPATRGRVLYC
jgi:hypothetical protein